jgi:hypothetical protein
VAPRRSDVTARHGPSRTNESALAGPDRFQFDSELLACQRLVQHGKVVQRENGRKNQGESIFSVCLQD